MCEEATVNLVKFADPAFRIHLQCAKGRFGRPLVTRRRPRSRTCDISRAK